LEGRRPHHACPREDLNAQGSRAERPKPVGDLKRLDGKALTAQTAGKRVLGLRVMQRDGSAPTVNQISVRTVLRLIDHSPLGLIVMLLTGKRRQRIGDVLAGTTVGPAIGPVPKPASSPLLVIYPVGWLIGAIVWFAGTADARSEGEYLQQASAICATTADAWMPDISTSQWLAVLEAERRGDVAAFKRIERRAHALDKRRKELGRAGLPACG
jgi:RDD family